MLGLALGKYVIPEGVIPVGLLGSRIVGTMILLVMAGGVIGAITVRCEYCGKGWSDYQGSVFKGLFKKSSNVWHYPTDIPDECPTCVALFK